MIDTPETDRHSPARTTDHLRHVLNTQLRIRQLIIYMAVYDAQNILAASKLLSLDHSTVSKTIAEMEQALGLPLFARRPRGVTATEAGNIVYRHAVRIFSQGLVTAKELTSLQAGETGQIRCGVVSFMDEFVARALAQFKSKYPNVNVQLSFANFQHLQRECELGQLDFVIGRINVEMQDSNLFSEIICEDPTSLVVKSDHPVLAIEQPTLADLSDYPWMLPPSNSPMYLKIEQRFIDERVPLPRNTIECASMFVVRTMLDEIPNLVTMPPQSIFSRHMAGKDYQMLPIRLFEHNSPLGFLYRSDAIGNEAVRSLQTLIRDALTSKRP